MANGVNEFEKVRDKTMIKNVEENGIITRQKVMEGHYSQILRITWHIKEDNLVANSSEYLKSSKMSKLCTMKTNSSQFKNTKFSE